MSDTSWHYLSNQFETATRGSFKRTNILNNDHLSKLNSEAADPDMAALSARTAPLSAAFSAAYSNYIMINGTYKGHTQLVDNLLLELSSQKIKQWDIQVQVQHLEGTPTYMMILPNRRGPFQEGTKDDRLSAVEALAEALLAYPALAATQADVDSFATQLRTARDNQQQKEQLAAMASDQLEVARKALCTMMYGNLGVLMDKYRDTPDMIENFWQLDLIRRTGQGNDDDDLPQNGIRIAGTVRSQNGNMGIPNALVRAYNAMQGPGAGTMEVFSGADGSYLLAVDDLPEAIMLVIEVSAAGYPSQSRNLNVSPGQTYEGEDFYL